MSELEKFPKSYLHSSATFAMSAHKGDTTIIHEISRDVRAFRVIRHFMETGEILVPQDPIDRHLLMTEAVFYGMDALVAGLHKPKVNTSEVKSPTMDQAETLAVQQETTKGAWCGPSQEWMNKNKGSEVKTKTKNQKMKQFFIPAQRTSQLNETDALIRAQEHAVRVKFGKDEKASISVSSGMNFNYEDPGYTYLTYPGRGRAHALPMIATQAEFEIQNAAQTMDLLSGVFGKLPLVQAGGSVLAALHRWPDVRIPKEQPVYSQDPFENVAIAVAYTKVPSHGHRYYGREELKKPNKKVPDQKIATTNALIIGPRCGPLGGGTKCPGGLPALPSGPLISALSFSNGIRWKKDKTPMRMRGGLGLSIMGISETDIFRKFRVQLSSREFVATFFEDAFAEKKKIITTEKEIDIERLKKDGLDDWKRILQYATPHQVTENNAVQALHRALILKSFCRTDVDLFLTTRDPTEAAETIIKFYDHIRAKIPAAYSIYIKRTKQAVTFLLPWPYRNIQIILRLYHSIEHVLVGFDVDCCAVGYDGKNLVILPRAARAISTRSNIFDRTRMSTTHETRYAKYAERGFDVALIRFDADIAEKNIVHSADLTPEENLYAKFRQRATHDTTKVFGEKHSDYDETTVTATEARLTSRQSMHWEPTSARS